MKRTSHQDADCPIARSLDAIGDWWSLLIVRDALLGLSRFGEFQKSLGMAKNILAARLRSLTALGILDAVPAADGSQHREYRLTPKGSEGHTSELPSLLRTPFAVFFLKKKNIST